MTIVRRTMAFGLALAALVLGIAWIATRGPVRADVEIEPAFAARVEALEGARADVVLAAPPEATSRTDVVDAPNEVVMRSVATHGALPSSSAFIGRVVDDRGVPVASYVLRADPVGADAESRRYATDRFERADGVFRLDGATDGAWSLVAIDAAGLRSVPRDVELPRDAALLHEIVLARPASITGRVLRADGSPAVAAHVAAWALDASGNAAAGESLRSGTTDEAGEFRLDHVPAVALEVTAKSATIASSTAPRFSPRPGGAIDGVVVTLQAGGSIEGVLVDASAAPRADEPVRVRAHGTLLERSTSTDEGGAFRFDDLPRGRFTVTAAPPAAAEADLSADVQVEALRVTRVDLGSGPPPRIRVRGVVHDGANARVVYRRLSASSEAVRVDGRLVLWTTDTASFPMRSARAHADGEGRYEIALAAGGSYVVTLVAGDGASSSRTVELTEEAEQVVDFRFGACSVSGTLVDASDRPVAGFVALNGRAVRVDESGRFEFTRLDPGEHEVAGSIHRPSAEGDVFRRRVTGTSSKRGVSKSSPATVRIELTERDPSRHVVVRVQ